jgi:signal transduction histidine kinase
LIAFSGASTNFLLWYDIPIPPVGTIVVPFYVGLVALAAIRYQFMDIKITITRTGLLLGVYLVVLGVPFVLGGVGRGWLERRLDQNWWLVPLGLCTALATAGPFAYASLRRQAEARLLKEQRRYQRTLQAAARGMTRVRDVKKLANLITRLVSRTVRLTHASLLLWDPTRQRYLLRASHGPKRLALQSRYELETSHPLIQRLTANRRAIAMEEFAREPQSFVSQELEQLEASLVVPGMIEDHLVGFLALGSKVSGEGYSTDDLHAFTTLANEAAVAIENAISYEELLRMNRQLKAASERLLIQERQAAAGQIAAGMAHEIKNPLSAIKTFAQYLPERYKNPDFREKFFRIVQAQIDRINEIVLELSDFARPSPPQLQPVQLSELVKETLSFLSNQCLQQKVEIRNAVKPNGLPVAADPQQLRQVLLNLFLNSLEAMSEGGRLEVASQPNGAFLTLRVSDTGSGISPDDQRRVWDPFFTTKERGMGLGLAIVKGIIERHGGRIHLSSAPGKGTTVELALPVAPSG